MNSYKTSEIAKLIGIHPNTVRLYEEWGMIPRAERMQNGYRVFTDYHVAQLKLARTALKSEIIQSGLRKKSIEVVMASARGEFDHAIDLVKEYLSQLQIEKSNSEEAIHIVEHILTGEIKEENDIAMRRSEVSEYLNITMDTLRNWELNGLLTVKRKENGYRIYTNEDIKYLKIIKALRCANYSLEAILRMINRLSKDPCIDINKVLNTPQDENDIISACDQLIISLEEAAENAKIMIEEIRKMKVKFS